MAGVHDWGMQDLFVGHQQIDTRIQSAHSVHSSWHGAILAGALADAWTPILCTKLCLRRPGLSEHARENDAASTQELATRCAEQNVLHA